MKTLHLTLHKKWFEEIASGNKKEEYREMKKFWEKRLVGKSFDEIIFVNGYHRQAPWMRVECKGMVTKEWDGKMCYALQLGDVLEIKNYFAK